MQNKNTLHSQKGSYTLLLSMIIAVLLVSLFIFRQDLFNGGKKEKNILEKGTDAVNQAKDISASQEQHVNEVNQYLENE